MTGPVTPLQILDALWTALKENYPAFEFVAGATGDAWRDEFRARLANVTEPNAAYPILEELVHRFHDYHTGLHWPDRPPVQSPAARLGFVEDQIAVTRCEQHVTGLRPGDVVLEINHASTSEMFSRRLAVARGATVYARRQWACDRLLEGPPGTTVVVRVARENGMEDTRTLRREGWTPREQSVIEAREIAPDAGIIRIPAWHAPRDVDLSARFDAALEAFRDKPILLLDVRGNGGGIDALADAVTGRFLREPIVSSISFHRTPGTNTYEKTVEIAQPRGPWRYAGRFAVLTDEDCCSACEHFVSGMNAAGALLVGRPTTGACGWSRAIPLPGGAILACSMTFPFHGREPSPLHGIEPHRLVLPTLAALRSGRDEIAEIALEILRGPLRPQ